MSKKQPGTFPTKPRRRHVRNVVASTLFTLVTALCPPLLAQSTMYVDDQLVVEVRAGMGIQYKIIEYIRTGDRVAVLEEDGDYAKVRTSKGTEGYARLQYLTNTPAARDQLVASQAEIRKLRESNNQLQARVQELSGNLNSATVTTEELDSSRTKLEKELAEIKSISANAINLNTDNQRLLLENQELRNKLDVIGADNQRLTDQLKNDQFMNGALAVLLGIIIALVVPRLVPKKKSEWG